MRRPTRVDTHDGDDEDDHDGSDAGELRRAAQSEQSEGAWHTPNMTGLGSTVEHGGVRSLPPACPAGPVLEGSRTWARDPATLLHQNTADGARNPCCCTWPT